MRRATVPVMSETMHSQMPRRLRRSTTVMGSPVVAERMTDVSGAAVIGRPPSPASGFLGLMSSYGSGTP